MGLSRKVILASCVCAAFLVGVFSCMIEERDLDKGGVFKCRATPGCFEGEDLTCVPRTEDNEAGCRPCSITPEGTCLAGSVCVVTSPDKTDGLCVPEDEVPRCHDYDGDGFYSAWPGYEDRCGFTKDNPRDCDDNDPNVYPGAVEYCDGKDNNCDGCVDGICQVGADCTGSDKSKCQPLVRLCFGVGSPDGMKDVAVCSPKVAGVLLCQNQTFVYAKRIDDKYVVQEGGKCPEADSIPYEGKTLRYVEDERAINLKDRSLCDGWDNDCNGYVDDGCVECKVDDKTKCFVTDVSGVTLGNARALNPNDTASLDYNTYRDIIDNKCGGDEARCGCVGDMECNGSVAPVCTKGGIELNATNIKQQQASGDTSHNWNCL